MHSNSKVGPEKITKDDKGSIPKSVAILERGVPSARELRRALAMLMADVAAGRATATAGNAIANLSGKILKSVELEFKFGSPDGSAPSGKLLELHAMNKNG